MGHYPIVAKVSKVGALMLGPKWPEKATGVVGVLLPSGVGLALKLWPELSKGNGWGQALFLASAFAGVALVAMCAAFAMGRHQWASPRRQALKLVNRLHAEWFPGPDNDLDHGYRVSFWVPKPDAESPRAWHCLHRTITGTAREWEHTTLEEKLRYSGPIVFSAAAEGGVNIRVPGVIGDTARRDPTCTAKYCAQLKVSDKDHKTLTWKYASLRSAIVRGDNGAVCAVLLIERESGEPIELPGKDFLTQENGELQKVDVLAVELALVTRVWGAAISPPEGTK